MGSKTGNVIVRYLVASVGLFMIAFAIALAIKSNLGTAPLSCLAYVLNLDMPGISVGVFTFIVNMFYILVQLAVLRRRFKPAHLMQIVASVLFGYMIDLSLWMIGWLEPDGFGVRLLLILAAAAVTALGTSIEVASNAWMVSAEMTVAAFSSTFRKDFGRVKMFMDTTMLIVFIFTVMVLITTGITYMYRHKLKLRWNYLWLPLIAAAIISLLFLGICQYVRSTFQYHWHHFPITYGAGTVRVTIANPEIYDSTIVAVCESTAKDCLFIKDYLRPFMEYNCRILLFSEADKFPKEELIKYAVTQSKDTKLFFLLANKQSTILFPVIANLAPASDGLIICDIPTHALSGAPVSPEEYADQLRCKTLFINHGFNTNSTLQKVIISNNIPCEMLDLPEEKPFTESIPAIISFLK